MAYEEVAEEGQVGLDARIQQEESEAALLEEITRDYKRLQQQKSRKFLTRKFPI